MGNVCEKKRKKKDHIHPFLVGQTQALSFTVYVKSVKLMFAKSTSWRRLKYKMEFGKFYEFESFYIANSFHMRWKEYRKFRINCQAQELLTDNFRLMICNENNKKVCATKMSLYAIATGPQHNSLELNKNNGARIMFNIRMIQDVNLDITVNELAAYFNEPLRNLKYTFSLKLIGNKQYIKSKKAAYLNNPNSCFKKNPQTAETKSSKITNQKIVSEFLPINLNEYNDNDDIIDKKVAKYCNPPENHVNAKKDEKSPQNFSNDISPFTPTFSYKFEQNKKKISRSKMSNNKPSQIISKIPQVDLFIKNNEKFQIHQTLIWNNKECKLPSLSKLLISTKSLANTCLQIWIIANDSKNTGSSSFKPKEKKLLGTSNIGLIKLLDQDPSILAVNSSNHKITSTLLWQGNQIGTITAEITLQYTNFIRQQATGVRTEEGVKPYVKIYTLDKITNSNFKLAEYMKLETYFTKFRTLENSVFGKESQSNQNKNKLETELISEVTSMTSLLNESHHNEIKFFDYPIKEELMQMQFLLIEISAHLIETANLVSHKYKEYYYSCLNAIFDREELSLINLRFFENNSSKSINSKKKLIDEGNINYLKKLKIAAAYQKILYQAFNHAFELLGSIDKSEEEIQFSNNILALSYFRVPEFHSKLIQVLMQNMNLPSLRSIELLLDEEDEDEAYINYDKSMLDTFFDWNDQFYQFVNQEKKGKKNLETLEKPLNKIKNFFTFQFNIKITAGDIFEQLNYQDQLELLKKSELFCYFLYEWTNYVAKSISCKKHNIWKEIPGYIFLLRGTLTLMRVIEIKNYSEALIKATCGLLQNHKLLNVFVKLVFSKTNVIDSVEVFQIFELLNIWFRHLRICKRKFPSNFDSSFFIDGIKKVIKCDHAMCIAKVFRFLSNNFNSMPPNLQLDLCFIFLEKNFLKLFLHWSQTVRVAFSHFLCYGMKGLPALTFNKNLNDEKERFNFRAVLRKNLAEDIDLIINIFVKETEEYKANQNINEKITTRRSSKFSSQFPSLNQLETPIIHEEAYKKKKKKKISLELSVSNKNTIFTSPFKKNSPILYLPRKFSSTTEKKKTFELPKNINQQISVFKFNNDQSTGESGPNSVLLNFWKTNWSKKITQTIIPSRLKVYLLSATIGFYTINKEYLEWMNNEHQKMLSMTEIKKKKILKLL